MPETVVTAEPDTGYSSTHSGTALGVPIPLEDTPQSVLTVKRQVLEDQQATTLWDGLRNVSGVFQSRYEFGCLRRLRHSRFPVGSQAQLLPQWSAVLQSVRR